MALQLEPDHSPEIRARDRRQLHCLGDLGSPRQADLGVPRADTRLEQLTVDGSGRILVSRDAEGRHEAVAAEPPPEGDDVDLPVPEREPDYVPHGTVPCDPLTTPDLAPSDRLLALAPRWLPAARRTSAR